MCHSKLSLLIQRCMVCIKPIQYDVLTSNHPPHRIPKVLIQVPWIRVSTSRQPLQLPFQYELKHEFQSAQCPTTACIHSPIICQPALNMWFCYSHTDTLCTCIITHTKLCQWPHCRRWYDFLGAPGSLVDDYPSVFHTDT